MGSSETVAVGIDYSTGDIFAVDMAGHNYNTVAVDLYIPCRQGELRN